MKYKIGDKVKVRSDLKSNADYSGIYTHRVLVDECAGKVFEITAVNSSDPWYLVGRWWIAEEMIEGLAGEETKHMTAEEIVEWFRRLYSADDKNDAFDDMPDGYGISDLLERYSAQEIVQKIEEYETRPKEPTVESVAQIYTITFRGEPIDDKLWTPDLPIVWTRTATTYSDGTTMYTQPQKMEFAERGGWTD